MNLHPEKRKVGAAPHDAVGPAPAAGLTLAVRPPHAGPPGQAMSDRLQMTPILLTQLLTTNLDERGRDWNCPVTVGRASGPNGQQRSDLDKPDLATDQKVGGSSPSERAQLSGRFRSWDRPFACRVQQRNTATLTSTAVHRRA